MFYAKVVKVRIYVTRKLLEQGSCIPVSWQFSAALRQLVVIAAPSRMPDSAGVLHHSIILEGDKVHSTVGDFGSRHRVSTYGKRSVA